LLGLLTEAFSLYKTVAMGVHSRGQNGHLLPLEIEIKGPKFSRKPEINNLMPIN